MQCKFIIILVLKLKRDNFDSQIDFYTLLFDHQISYTLIFFSIDFTIVLFNYYNIYIWF